MTWRLAERSILVADRCPAMRRWLATSVNANSENLTEVSCAWEVLWHLSKQEYDLIVVGAKLVDMSPIQLLATVRTTGLEAPFLLVHPCCHEETVVRIRSMPPSDVIDDWSDGTTLRMASELLLASPKPKESAPPRTRLLRAAESAAGSFLRDAAHRRAMLNDD